MKKLLFLSVVALLLFSSCSKEGNTNIQGKVVYDQTDTPAPNITVIFKSWGAASGWQRPIISEDRVISKEDGTFQIQIPENEKTMWLSISITDDDASTIITPVCPNNDCYHYAPGKDYNMTIGVKK